MGDRRKVFFYEGEELGLKVRVAKGMARVDGAGLTVEGPDGKVIRIPATDILGIEMFRLHGLSRVIKVDHRRGRLFLAVVRLMIGQFAFVNFFRTGSLYTELAELRGHAG